MTVEPVYPLTEGLSLNVLAKATTGAQALIPDLPEWLDSAYQERQGWASWSDSLHRAHAPDGEAALDPLAPARARLAYDELLANQLALLLVRQQMRRLPGRPIAGDGQLRRQLEASLPFTLTESQVGAGAEIAEDMASSSRMLRLLQGDVGSGKTVVALMAMLTAVEAGGQAALMAPDGCPGPPAPGDHRTAGRGNRCAGGNPYRPRERQSPGIRHVEPGRWPPVHHRRHPRAVSKGGRVPRPGAGGHRRAASFRSASASGPDVEGQGRGRSGDDRHAYPSDPHADRLWGHGCLAFDRKAGRTSAHRHPGDAPVAPRRGDRGGGAGP